MSQSEGSLEPPGWGEALREHLPLLVLVALCAAAWLALDALLGPRFDADLGFLPTYVGLAQCLWLPLPLAFALLRLRARKEGGTVVTGAEGWSRTWLEFRARYLNAPRAASAVATCAGVALVLNGFGSWKRAIPSVQPFSWDQRLHTLDHLLHLGHAPWELIQPVVGHPAATIALDILYFYFWFPLLGLMVAWQSWSCDRRERTRFFLGLVLTWLFLGNVAATALSSAGPPYYAQVVAGNGDPYAPLMAYLHAVDAQWRVVAVHVQGALWRVAQDGTATPYAGISAMPSLHVALPVLYVFTAWGRSRLLAFVLLGYAVVILLGSVHLGWHYAVDGYASIAGVAGVWWLAGRIAAMAHSR